MVGIQPKMGTHGEHWSNSLCDYKPMQFSPHCSDTSLATVLNVIDRVK